MAKEQHQSNLKERVEIKEPHLYKVIFHNDDFTTMEFVVEVLEKVFFKSAEEAEMLMMAIHKQGKAVVGIYTYDIAKSKVKIATDMALQANFPLRITYSAD